MDVRPYMDTAPYTINSSSSIQRCYRFFRTMGLRHLVVLDNDHRVTGIITRKDITEHRLEHHWFQEGDNMQKFMNVDPMEPGMVTEGMGLLNDDVHQTPSIVEERNTNMSVFEVQESPMSSSSSHGNIGTYAAPPPTSNITQSAAKSKDQKAMKEPKSSKR